MPNPQRFGWLMLCALGVAAALLTACGDACCAAEPVRKATVHRSTNHGASTPPVDMFAAIDDATIEVKFIPRNSREATLLVKNKSDRPLSVKLPETFVGVPILAQFGGQNNPFPGLGQQGGNQQNSNSNSAPQGLGSGNQANQGHQDFWNIPPEKVVKIRVDCVCLDYGHPEPTPRMPYEIQKTESYVDRPAVVKLLKTLGSTGVDQQAVQAATWYLNNDLSWQKLATRWSTEVRLVGTSPPMFSPNQMKAARKLADGARREAGEPIPPDPPKSNRSTGQRSAVGKTSKNMAQLALPISDLRTPISFSTDCFGALGQGGSQGRRLRISTRPAG